MTTRRRAARLLLVLGASSGAVVLAVGPAAAAAGVSVTKGSDGSTVSVNQPVTSDDLLSIRAQIDPRTSTTDLVVIAPGGGEHTVAEASGTLTSGATMTFDLNTACLSYDPRRAPCSGRAPALNGTWTAQLRGGASSVAQFTLRIPPARPDGVSATAASNGVTVSWQPGAEPDLTSYDVLDGSGRQIVGGLSPGDVCSGGTCSTRLPASSAQTFTVRAHRATCPTCSETLASAPSDPATVASSNTATPVPSQTGSTTGAGSQPGTASGTASGGTASAAPGASSAASNGSSKHPTSASTAAKTGPRGATSSDPGRLLQQLLPPPTADAPPVVPSSVLLPLADGSYKPKLAYGEQTVGENVLVPDGSAPQVAGDNSSSVLSGLDSRRVWQSVGEGLLLLVVCAHLMAWLARTRPE